MSKQRMVMVLALVSAARMARANDWTELGSDSGQSRYSSEVSGPVFSPSWSYALGSGQIIATPVSSGGDIVVAGSSGAVAAVNATDGSVVWSRMLDQQGVRATPTISHGQVAVSTMGGMLYSLNLGDGSIAWQTAFGGQNMSSPQLVPGTSPGDPDTLILGAGPFAANAVWRFNALTGQPLWQTADGAIVDMVYSTASVSGDHVIIGMNHGRYQSIDIATGAVGWKYDASGDVNLSSPLVVGDRVYMFPGDAGAHVYAADANTGAAIAGFPVAIPDLMPVAGGSTLGNGPHVSSPMTIAGLVVVQLRRNDVLSSGQVVMRESIAAIDPSTAAVLWQYPVANVTAANTNDVPQLELCATPAGFSGVGGSYIAVSSSITGRMAVLDAKTGAELWSTSLSSPGRSSPVFSNGQLIVATDDSVLHAFSSMTNHPPSAPTMPGPAGDQVFASSGTVLNWQPASDIDGDPLSYVVRVEQDGAPGTRVEAETAVGETQMTVMLQPNTSYVFAVRSRDADGALSAWSAAQLIQIGDGTPTTSAPADAAIVMIPSSPTSTTTTTASTTTTTAPTTTTTASTTTTTASTTTTTASTTTSTSSTTTSTTSSTTASTTSTQTTKGTKQTTKGKTQKAATIATSDLALATAARQLAFTTPSADDNAMPPAAMTRQVDLAPSAGCSTAGGGTSSPAAIAAFMILAFVVRRRARLAKRSTGSQAA